MSVQHPKSILINSGISFAERYRLAIVSAIPGDINRVRVCPARRQQALESADPGILQAEPAKSYWRQRSSWADRALCNSDISPSLMEQRCFDE
jgi:hypothetical protein